jgi:hypothetical protein
MAALSTTPSTNIAGLLVMTYDATGLASVLIEGWPLLGWQIDDQNPINPKPFTLGNPLATPPPNTGTIKSPQWAYISSVDAVYTPDGWRGTITEFFNWLATNNGATRVLSADLTFPEIVNAWNIWARQNSSFVASAQITHHRS